MQHFAPTAYDTTAADLANALLGFKRVIQWVNVSERRYSGGRCTRILVTVIPGMSEPDGKAIGSQYVVSERTLSLLMQGVSPEELELEAEAV